MKPRKSQSPWRRMMLREISERRNYADNREGIYEGKTQDSLEYPA